MLNRCMDRIDKLLIYADIPTEDRGQYKNDIKTLIKEATELRT